MDESNKKTLNICIIGSSKLTEEIINFLTKKNNKPKIIFGLKKNNLSKKSYSYNQDFIAKNLNIKLIKNESWITLNKYLKKFNIDLILSFGNSKIIPRQILKNYKIIGNHGAELPYIKGGASLSWGRMMNLGFWYTSIFELNDKIDNGKILTKKKFTYKKNISMKEFYNLSIFNTVLQFHKLYFNNFKNLTNVRNSNQAINITNIYSDTYEIILNAKKLYRQKKSIYLGSRTPKDSYIFKKWPKKFKTIFKIANNDPFPKYFY